MTTTPKTIDLPPEPPIGTEWRDRDGNQWRHEPEGWMVQGGTARHPWSAVCRYLPLTLIEPDPWPTAPLIVATFLDKRAVFGRTNIASYDSPTGGVEAYPNQNHALTNVVPVTVAPTAALPVLWSALEQWLNGPRDALDNDMRRLAGAVVGLREQIDALGLDQ